MVKEITNVEIEIRIDELKSEIAELETKLKMADTVMEGFIKESLSYAKEMLEAYTSQLRVRRVGRPSVGTTKKVSLTLTDDVWELVAKKKDEWSVSQSQALRMMIDSYFKNHCERKFCLECGSDTEHLKNDESGRLYCKDCGLYHN